MSCSHTIVSDYIDIEPDRSVQIFYCSICFNTIFDKDDISGNNTQNDTTNLVNVLNLYSRKEGKEEVETKEEEEDSI